MAQPRTTVCSLPCILRASLQNVRGSNTKFTNENLLNIDSVATAAHSLFACKASAITLSQSGGIGPARLSVRRLGLYQINANGHQAAGTKINAATSSQSLPSYVNLQPWSISGTCMAWSSWPGPARALEPSCSTQYNCSADVMLKALITHSQKRAQDDLSCPWQRRFCFQALACCSKQNITWLHV